MRRLLTISLFFLVVISLRAQRYDIISQDVCWNTGSVDSSLTRYFLVSTRASNVKLLTYLNATGQSVDVSGGGSFAQGHCGCCGGSSTSLPTASSPARSGLTNDNDTLKLGGVVEENTSIGGMNEYGLDVTNWKYLNFSASDSFKIITPGLISASIKEGGLLQVNSLTGLVEFTPYAFPLTTGIDGQFQQLNGTTGELEWRSPYVTAVKTDSSYRFSVNGSSISEVPLTIDGDYEDVRAMIRAYNEIPLDDTISTKGSFYAHDGAGGVYKKVAVLPSGYSATNSGNHLAPDGNYFIPIANQRFHPVMWGADPTDDLSDSDAFSDMATFLNQSGIFPDSTYRYIECGYGYANYILDSVKSVAGGIQLPGNLIFDPQGATFNCQAVEAFDIDGNSVQGNSGSVFSFYSGSKNVVFLPGKYVTQRKYIPVRQSSEYNELICLSCPDTIQSNYDFQAQAVAPSPIPYVKASNLKLFNFSNFEENFTLIDAEMIGFNSCGDPSGKNMFFNRFTATDVLDGWNVGNCDNCVFEQFSIDRSGVGNDTVGLIHAFYVTSAPNLAIRKGYINGPSGIGIRMQANSNDSLTNNHGRLILEDLVLENAGRIELSHPFKINVNRVNWWSVPDKETSLFRLHSRSEHLDVNNITYNAANNRPGDLPLIGIDQLATANAVNFEASDWTIQGDSLRFQMCDLDSIRFMDISKISFTGRLPASSDKGFIKLELPDSNSVFRLRDAEINLTDNAESQSLVVIQGAGSQSSEFRQICDIEDVHINKRAYNGNRLFLINPKDSAISLIEKVFFSGDIDQMGLFRSTSAIDTNTQVVLNNIYKVRGKHLEKVGQANWSSSSALWSQTGSDLYYDAGNVGINDATPTEAELTIKGRLSLDFGVNIGNMIITTGSSYSNLTGQDNWIAGREAAANITSGSNNVFTGKQAGLNCTTCSGNVGQGRESLRGITTGSNNTALGDVSLLSLTTASHVVGIGRGAGLNCTTCSNSVFIGGNNTGAGIVDGIGNTIIGSGVVGLTSSLSNNLILATHNGIKIQSDDTGTTSISGYGQGDKEATDLSKTASDYYAVWATDNTILEKPRKQGIAATTAGPGTTLVITHDLGQAPTYISITPGGDVGGWYIDTINSTTMTLNYTSTATTTASSINIYWQVE